MSSHPAVAVSALTDLDENLLSAATTRDPYSYFARLRDIEDVHWNPLFKAWVVSRYDDAREVLLDTARYSSDRISPWYRGKLSAEEQQMLEPTYRLLGGWMVFNDPPDHTHLRRAVHLVFTPRRVALLHERVEQVSRELIDGLRGRGEVDLLADYAYHMPAMVIAELLGVPPEDRDVFKAWSEKLAAIILRVEAEGRFEDTQQGLLELEAYFATLIARLRDEPDDNLLSALIHAPEADRLSPDELTSMCILLLFAGHETTTNLIANGMVALLENPDQLALLRKNPTLGASAAEECLRFVGPVKMTVRVLTDDVALRGKQMRRGQRVLLAIAGANRDPQRFTTADPETLDITRSDNAHLTFGHGIHFCLGGPLARLEAAVAFRDLAEAFPAMRLACPAAQLPWVPTIFVRGLRRLPVDLGS